MTLLTRIELTDWARNQRKELGLAQFDIELTLNHSIELSTIRVCCNQQHQGRGTVAMQRLTALADQYQLPIVLTPAEKNKVWGTTSKQRLIKFYKQFGFISNRGAKRDFSTRATMIRYPINNSGGCDGKKN